MASIAIPKTVTSKKGHLSIVSESLKTHDAARKQRKHLGGRINTGADSLASEATFSAITVDELASSVLQFGSKGNESVCLDIQQLTSTKQEPRIVRPGFSARRYLASWTKTLNEDTVNTWLNLGKLSETTIFQTNAFLPHLKKRANDNLSEYPAPYRIVKQMLVAPGPLNEYSFIWGKKEVSDDGLSRGDIQVFSENKAELVKYSELDKETQKGILSKLLVKSALNYGLSRAHEAAGSASSTDLDGAELPHSPAPFDMVSAVRNLLDRDTDALREEGDARLADTGAEGFSPEDERVFERIRQKRMRDQLMRRQQLHASQRSQQQQNGGLAMMGEHIGPEFELQDWERQVKRPGPSPSTAFQLPPLAQQSDATTLIASRGLRDPAGGGRTPRQAKLPRLGSASDDTMGEDGAEETDREEAKDRVGELPGFDGATSGPIFFGSMPKARGVWGNFSQQQSRRKRPQSLPQQQQLQQTPDASKGVHLKTPDLFLGAEPENPPEDDGASDGSQDLANVRLKTRKSRLDARNASVRSPIKREINLKGGDLDATEFLVTHKANDGHSSLLSTSASQLPTRTGSPSSQITLASIESGALELGGRGLIAPVLTGPDGQYIDVAAMSQEQLMSVLTQHAEEVAETVLQGQSAGQDIAEDVQKAINDLMTQRGLSVPQRRRVNSQAAAAAALRRSQKRPAVAGAGAAATGQSDPGGITGDKLARQLDGSDQERVADDQAGQEDSDDDDDGVMDAEQAAEEAAFKLAIKAALISALNTGDSGPLSGDDIDLPDDILETLAASSSAGLRPADLVLTVDPTTGRRVISTREKVLSAQRQQQLKTKFPDGTPAEVQRALKDLQQDPAGAMAALQQLASQHVPSSASTSVQDGTSSNGKQKSKQKSKQKPSKEAFKVLRVKHKDDAQSVFTGGVSREASNVEEINLPRIPSNLKKSSDGDANAVPNAGPRKLKPSKKKPPKPPSSAADADAATAGSAAASATSPTVTASGTAKDEKPEKKKGGGKKRAGRRESILPGEEIGERRSRDENETSFVRVEEYFSDDNQDGGQRDPTTMMEGGDVDGDDLDVGDGGDGLGGLFPPDQTDEEFERELQEKMRRLSVKEQRELRRKSEAERRRRDTIRRRSEAVDKKRLNQELAERQAQLEQEMEAERLRKEEEVRERRRREREARELAEAEAEAAERRERQAKDREQREREMFMRRLQEARRLKEEEEQRQRLEEMLRQEEEERLRREEDARIAHMEEKERLEYLRQKAEEAERIRREAEEERIRKAEQARIALEEARRLAEELAAVRAAELARRRFQRSLKVERAGHDRYLSLTHAFEFSYFDLLKWVGINLPEAVKA